MDVALTASRHVYERWAPESGLVRFIVGTGGRSLGKLNSGAVVGVRPFGILRLTLNATACSSSFVDINGTVGDWGNRGTATADRGDDDTQAASPSTAGHSWSGHRSRRIACRPSRDDATIG